MQGEGGYRLNELVVYKGKSAHREGKMFERVIRLSHVKDSSPIKVRDRLENGPRQATKGFSHH